MSSLSDRFGSWFFEGLTENLKKKPEHQDSWWKIMCLTGLDYFSTLGYQPGIAFLAAGVLSPLATLVVVLVTMFGLVPLYFQVARCSPHGLGSIGMLEELVHGWRGKTLVLVLLGFAATDFIITITLSAADATAHLIENPVIAPYLASRLGATLCLLGILSAVFLVGFREVVGLAVLIVISYLICNLVVVGRCFQEIALHPGCIQNWQHQLFTTFPSIGQMVLVAMLLFPKLALGMSGFETGVAVMPLVRGAEDDDPGTPAGRIKNTRKLLLVAASIMAVFLMTSSLVTTLLIPAAAFAPGGHANGRALAYLAHKLVGPEFGTVYDLSTISILWFAGASAMAGLLTLVPRYLPRYGMAPDWARAQRPLVLFLTVVAFTVTILFRADVDAQAGAYATGLLVLFTSAALAVVIVTWRQSTGARIGFIAILITFIYTSIANMVERPEGLQIASFFITVILLGSMLSRGFRSLELRVKEVRLDDIAEGFVEELAQSSGHVCLLSHRPGRANYAEKEAETRRIHKVTSDQATFIFFEVEVTDPSEFTDESLDVTGDVIDGNKVLRCQSFAVPNAIAAMLLYLRDRTSSNPHAYFGWKEGNPFVYLLNFILFGEGETASLTQEILREAEPDPEKRPKIIVG